MGKSFVCLAVWPFESRLGQKLLTCLRCFVGSGEYVSDTAPASGAVSGYIQDSTILHPPLTRWSGGLVVCRLVATDAILTSPWEDV